MAKKEIVTTAEIGRMLEDASKEFTKVKPVGLKKLGIDEIALKKGQGSYCAVLVDIETSKLLTILEKRTKEEIKKVLLDWGTEVLENIKEVSIDLLASMNFSGSGLPMPENGSTQIDSIKSIILLAF